MNDPSLQDLLDAGMAPKFQAVLDAMEKLTPEELEDERIWWVCAQLDAAQISFKERAGRSAFRPPAVTNLVSADVPRNRPAQV